MMGYLEVIHMDDKWSPEKWPAVIAGVYTNCGVIGVMAMFQQLGRSALYRILSALDCNRIRVDSLQRGLPFEFPL